MLAKRKNEEKEEETLTLKKKPSIKRKSLRSHLNYDINPNDWKIIQFAKRHPVPVTLVALAIMVVLILVIVLPLTLVKKKEDQQIEPICPEGRQQPRVDCLPDKAKLLKDGSNLESVCNTRKCCWSMSAEFGGPNCAFPTNYGFRNFKLKEKTFTNHWIELLRMNSPNSFARSDISNLEAKIEMQTDNRLRIRILPRRNFKNKIQRWEVPSGVKSENLFNPNYRIEMFDLPFGFKIFRNSTNQAIFDTTKSSLIFSDQFIQITTQLISPYVFGIGENSKESFMHDMNFKSWPIFASQNNPNTASLKSNLYSQFPMYLNIEPNGNSHAVVFYNSNPSEFYLTPFPSLTYRSIGGILDIYIFMGPTPVEALEQYQQAFGLPKLPPYWSLGLQIGAKKFIDSTSLKNFISRFKKTNLPFDSVLIGYEHMKDSTMFTLSNKFYDLNNIVDSLRNEHRAVILKMHPGIGNATQNLPFSDGISKEKYWILENFFSSGVTGQLFGKNVLYPDFTMAKTKEWWKDALHRFVLTDQTIKFDGLFLDYLTPTDETLNKTCPNNKWNFPTFLPDSIEGPIFNATICMDSRYESSKHYNIHGIYSHLMIEATAKALDNLIASRTMIMSRHAFIGTGQYSAKWLGEHDFQWDDLRKSLVGTIEMSMFGFSIAGADICGFNGDLLDLDLAEQWIKFASMSPMFKLTFDTDSPDDQKFLALMKKPLFETFNSTLRVRYELMPYFYTQLFKATKFGTIPVRPLAFEFPEDIRTYRIDNQFLWGDKLMVTIATSPSGISSTYLPKGEWYDYYKGFHRISSGESINVQSRNNETILHVRGGSVIFKEDSLLTASESKNSYMDAIIALDESRNFTAFGELYMDDATKKDADRKDNYHRLISFNVYREADQGVIEVKKLSGRYATRLSYRDLIVYGLRSKPLRIIVNENSQAVDGSKCTWDEVNSVYRVNLQTEIKRKVLIDNEYLTFRWFGGFETTIRKQDQSAQTKQPLLITNNSSNFIFL